MRKEKYSKSIESLNYEGEITVKLVDGERVLSTKKYHNTGREPLFNFFTYCLAGNFTAASDLRPCRIILFELDEGETAGTFKAEYWNDKTKVSSTVYYDSTVTPGAQDGISTITYHFRIPFLCLVGGANVRKVGLYPDTITSLSNDLCAYYFLDNEFTVPYGGGNFTVVIDWTLKIRNITAQEKAVEAEATNNEED